MTMLSGDRRSIKEIAAALEFCNEFYFSAFFPARKRHVAAGIPETFSSGRVSGIPAGREGSRWNVRRVLAFRGGGRRQNSEGGVAPRRPACLLRIQ